MPMVRVCGMLHQYVRGVTSEGCVGGTCYISLRRREGVSDIATFSFLTCR